MVDKENPDLINLHIGESVYVQPKDIFHIKHQDIFLVNRFAEIQHKLINPYLVKLICTPECMQLDLSLMKHCRNLDYNVIDDDTIKLVGKTIEEDEIDESDDYEENYTEEEVFDKKPIKMILCENVIESTEGIDIFIERNTFGSFNSFCSVINENGISPKGIIEHEFIELGINPH